MSGYDSALSIFRYVFTTKICITLPPIFNIKKDTNILKSS